MTVSAWRIVKRKLARGAFTGEGARIYGGRWNRPGVAMVYTAGSRALAALEIVVHLDGPELLAEYVVIGVEIDERLLQRLDRALLPKLWWKDPAPAKLQEIGSDWAGSNASAALEAPSALVPAESNFLLNPLHPDFSKIRIGKPEGFRFDARLGRRN